MLYLTEEMASRLAPDFARNMQSLRLVSSAQITVRLAHQQSPSTWLLISGHVNKEETGTRLFVRVEADEFSMRTGRSWSVAELVFRGLDFLWLDNLSVQQLCCILKQISKAVMVYIISFTWNVRGGAVSGTATNIGLR